MTEENEFEEGEEESEEATPREMAEFMHRKAEREKAEFMRIAARENLAEGEEFEWEDLEEEKQIEEIPLIGRLIDGIYSPKELIGGGGMCQVYKSGMKEYGYIAKEIIAGRKPLFLVGLTNEELGLPDDFTPDDFKKSLKKIKKREHPDKIQKGKFEQAIAIIKQKGKFFQNQLENPIVKKANGENDLKKAGDTSRFLRKDLMRRTHGHDIRIGDDNMVAFKVLRPSQYKTLDKKKDTKSIINRFINESRICCTFHHPNLVRGFDSGETTLEVEIETKKEDDSIETKTEERKVYYYSMEYVNAHDWKQYDEENPLPVQLGIGVTKAILNALDYLHSKGITHRDVKPDNIMVDDDSVITYIKTGEGLDARLGDYGLAKLNFEKFESDSKDLVTQFLTQGDKALGTPHYMSPEQLVGEVVENSDTWSLCATMYHLLTGRVPFGRNDSLYPEITAAIMNCDKPGDKPIAMSDINPNVPQLLEDIIMSNLIPLDIERTNDKARKIISITNTRMNAKEMLLAITDYESIQGGKYSEAELKPLRKGLKKEKIKIPKKDLEKTANMCFELLNKIKRDKVKRECYNVETVLKRKLLLETAIECTQNKTRKTYLERLLNYEIHLPIYSAPTGVKVKTPSLPLVKGLIIGLLGLGTIFGGAYTGITLFGNWENTKIYKKIKNNDNEARTQLEQGNIDEAVKIYTQMLKTIENKLPEDYKDEDSIAGNLGIDIAKKQSSAADDALKQRKFGEAKKHSDSVDATLEKVDEEEIQDGKKKKQELLKANKKRQETLDEKEASIASLRLVENSCPGLEKTYTGLETEVKDGKPFPEIEKIEQLKKNLDTYNLILANVANDFLDEKGEKTQEYKDLETKVKKLLRKSNRLEFSMSQEHLKELQILTKQLKDNYFAEKSAETLKQAENLHQQIQQIEQIINQTYLDPEKIDEFNDSLSTESTTIEEDTKIVNYFADLRKKSSEGDKNAKQILTLETRTRDSAQHMYIRNGVTTETITEYETQVNTYLAGENMRADMYLELQFDEFSKKLPEYREQIEKLKEQAKPLFSLSWKIQELDGIIDEKPKDETAKQEREKAITSFTETAAKLRTQFSALNLREYITQGTATADPIDYFFLGKAYQTSGDKKRAVQSYTLFLKTAKLGFQIDEEEIKQAEEAIKKLEQK